MELLFEIFLAAVLIFFMSQMAVLVEKPVAGDVLNAKGFPLIIASLALVMVTAAAVRYVLRCKKEGKPLFGDVQLPKSVVAVSGALLCYILVLPKIGFIICTLVYTFVNTLILGYKNKKVALIFALVLTVCFTLVFGRLFYVPLPRGVGMLKEWSYYIY